MRVTVWTRVTSFSCVGGPRCAARVFGRAAAAVLLCSPRHTPCSACPLNCRPLFWFNYGPFPAPTARNVAAKWECGLCLPLLLRKAASTVWMISALVLVPPSQRSARFLALPHSGRPTFLGLTGWVREKQIVNFGAGKSPVSPSW